MDAMIPDWLILTGLIVLGCYITAAAFGIPPIVPLIGVLIVMVICAVTIPKRS